MPKRHQLALAIGLTLPALTLAQSPEPIEEIRVTGELSRYSALKSDTPIMETARSVSIEGIEDIKDKGALALDDTFTYSAGVTGKTFGFATRGDWARVRGLDVPQYQDSLQSLFGNYNNTRPDVYTLEQVEILKGPASVLYGQGSPGGVINVVSKLPRAESAHEILAEVGTFDRRQLAFDSTGQLDDDGQWLYRTVGVYRDSDSQVDHVGETTKVIAPSITWRPTGDTDLTLLLNHTQTESDTGSQFLPVEGTLVPAPNGEHIENSTYTGEPGFNRYDTEATSLTFLASHQLNSVWSLELTSRYSDAESDYRQAWTSFLGGGERYIYNPDGSLYGDGRVPRTFYRQDGESEQAAVDVRLRADFDTGALSHEVLIGTQYQDVTLGDAGYYLAALGLYTDSGVPDDTYWINVFDPEYGNVPPQSMLDSAYSTSPDSTTEDLGLYLHDQINLGNWRFTAGLRFDETETRSAGSSQKDDAVSTSVGALYQFDNGLSPYVSYAESFEPVIGTNANGETLDPQEGEQVEAGVKYQPRRIPALITLAWFDIKQTNLNDPSSAIGDVEQQRGEASINGIELEGTVSLGDIEIELNASKIDTESAEGYRLASVPEDQASTWVTWRPGNWHGFKLGGGVRYVGESWGGADTIRTPSYTLVDLMVGYEVGRWDFTVNARNATDEDFQATCLSRGDCFPGEARTVVGRARYSF